LRTVARLLSAGTSSNTAARGAREAENMASTSASRPAPRTPLSVMTMGRLTDKALNSNGRCSSAWCPAMILTGQKNS